MTKECIGWHRRDTEVVVGAPSASFDSQEQRKKDKQRDENMAEVMTQIWLFSKYVMGASTKAVNVIASKSIKAYNDDEKSLK